MDDLNTLEDMDLPCSDDICDGSGLVEDENGNLRKCPHVMDTDEHEVDV